MILTWRKSAPILLLVALGPILGGCTPRQMIIGQLADELAAQAGNQENDLDLLRDAAPFHLKLSEAVLSRDPGHLALAESVAAGFAQYSYAFVAFEADKIENRDAKAAERLRRRAASLYERAYRHAMRALEISSPGISAALARQNQAEVRIPPEMVGLAYWAAASWGGWISLSKDSPDIVADLPLAVFLARQAWASNANWGQGALTSLLGTFEAARPGGSNSQALAYFDQAIEQCRGLSAGPLLAKAEAYALPQGNRELFVALLQQALAIEDKPGSLLITQNQMMKNRAQWLLDSADDLF